MGADSDSNCPLCCKPIRSNASTAFSGQRVLHVECWSRQFQVTVVDERIRGAWRQLRKTLDRDADPITHLPGDDASSEESAA
jgi:hypothetical protein